MVHTGRPSLRVVGYLCWDCENCTMLTKKYTVFHKKPNPETSCYNFKKKGFNIEKPLVQAIYTYDQSYSKCSKCCPLALTQALSRILHRSMASSTIVCSKSAQTLTSRCSSSARSQIETVQLVLGPYQTFQAQWIRNWMEAHCVKNHFRRTYFDKFKRSGFLWNTVYMRVAVQSVIVIIWPRYNMSNWAKLT